MKVLIYTKDNCPFCTKVKALFTIKGVDWTECKVNEDITREEFISLFPEQKTLPLVFINDEKVGGYEETRTYFDTKAG